MVSELKYFTNEQIKTLRETAEKQGSPRDWLIVDILTTTGLRVSEVADLRVGDLKTNGESTLYVRNGKGGKSRRVQIPLPLVRHIQEYISCNSYETPNDYLLKGHKGHIGRQGIEDVVEKFLRLINLFEPRKLVHSLRHSYAVNYYAKKHDLKGLQRQLGHASLAATGIYADVNDDYIQEQLQDFWG